MAELLSSSHSPVMEILVLALAFGFGLIRLGHAYLRLRRDWDSYQAERVRDPR